MLGEMPDKKMPLSDRYTPENLSMRNTANSDVETGMRCYSLRDFNEHVSYG